MREREIADLLEALAQALEESRPDDSEFQNGGAGAAGGGGQGGGGEQPLVPPAAQLQLLRGLQESVYRSTRELGEAGGLDRSDRDERAAELGESQQQVVDVARDLMRELQQQRGGPPQPQPQPGPEPEPEPQPEPDDDDRDESNEASASDDPGAQDDQ